MDQRQQYLIGAGPFSFLMGLAGVAIFGATLPFTRLAVFDFDPWFVTFARAVIASLCAALVLWAMKVPFPRKDAGKLLWTGILLVFGFPGFMAVAMSLVPASHGGIVLGILPLATTIFAFLIASERPTRLFWICSLLGTATILIYALRNGDGSFHWGDFWLLTAGISASWGYVISGKLSRTYGGWQVACWFVVLIAPLSVIGTIWLWEDRYLQASATGLAALGYLGLFSMFLGFFAWNTGLKIGGIAKVGQVQLLQTFFTLGVSALLLGEEITLEMLFFAVIVVAIVALGRRAQVGSK